MDYIAKMFYPCDRCKELHEMKAIWTQEALEDFVKTWGIDFEDEFMSTIINNIREAFEDAHPYDVFDPEVLIIVKDEL